MYFLNTFFLTSSYFLNAFICNFFKPNDELADSYSRLSWRKAYFFLCFQGLHFQLKARVFQGGFAIEWPDYMNPNKRLQNDNVYWVWNCFKNERVQSKWTRFFWNHSKKNHFVLFLNSLNVFVSFIFCWTHLKYGGAFI